MAILLLNRFRKSELDILEWFNDIDEEIYMITTLEAAEDYKNLPIVISLPTLLNNNRVEYEIMKLYKRNPFRILIGIEETDILRAGIIRDRYNLEGQSEYSAFAFRNKVKMKTLAGNGGIEVSHFKKLNTAFDSLDFITKYQYPVIIKPVDGMSSKGVVIINNENDLEKWLENGHIKGYMIEKYEQDSDVYHVDGIFMNGEIIFCCASKYIIPIIQYSLNKGGGSLLVNNESTLFKKLSKFVSKTLKALPTPNITSFHAEIFYNNKTEELKLCEIASRTIGGKTVELIKHSYGLDLDRFVTRAQCGSIDKLQVIQKTLSACYFVPPEIGYLREVPEKPDFKWCINYISYGIKDKYYMGPQKVFDHYIYFLVEGQTEEELLQRINIMLNYIKENSQWSL